ncbi:hypothetical protein [Reinekea marinisedimentorum]|uniref:Uncharacterized protein n=1 Tax=Reinekea marinisedimentorum TaxID=230495 RepID=A0A4R3HSN8_9GAMM|nr:hypothetical protein [Reinekea marinisedimentorum]TCS35684.1 hypothetical protein BCF53_1325 [Reinekea marinisedimentorum]
MGICLSISEINWALTKDVFSILGTLGALIIGSIGLFTWKRQLKGTSEYELAKKAILKTYQVEQAIQAVRNPMLHLKQEEVESGNQLQEEQRIYNERLSYMFEKWSELQTIRLESKVVWSTSAHSAFDDLQKVIGKLKASIWLHFWLKGAYAAPGATVDRDPDRVAENDKIVYFIDGEDAFSKAIKNSVMKVEGFFSSKIR